MSKNRSTHKHKVAIGLAALIAAFVGPWLGPTVGATTMADPESTGQPS